MKRFNFTGRKKFPRNRVEIHYPNQTSDNITVNVSVDLSDLNYPADAEVFIEPQRKVRFMRLRIGQVSDAIGGVLRRNNLSLDNFEDLEGLNFRLKIHDSSAKTILALAEHIKVRSDSDEINEDQNSILPVKSTDLSDTGELWRLNMDDEEAVLEVEKRLGTKSLVVREPWFQSLVFPAAVRQIFTKILNDSDWDDEFKEIQQLSTRWILFAKQHGAGIPLKYDISAQEDWLNDFLRILNNSLSVREEALKFLGGDD